jgi:predicted HTH transcriptional regulator
MIKPGLFTSEASLEHPESENIEYKTNWDNNCLRVVSAFANTNGGNLIVGVDDNKNFGELFTTRITRA